VYPELYANVPQGADQLIRPVDNKEGENTIPAWATRCRSRLTSVPRFHSRGPAGPDFSAFRPAQRAGSPDPGMALLLLQEPAGGTWINLSNSSSSSPSFNHAGWMVGEPVISHLGESTSTERSNAVLPSHASLPRSGRRGGKTACLPASAGPDRSGRAVAGSPTVGRSGKRQMEGGRHAHGRDQPTRKGPHWPSASSPWCTPWPIPRTSRREPTERALTADASVDAGDLAVTLSQAPFVRAAKTILEVAAHD
jgi:hypothetical protein